MTHENGMQYSGILIMVDTAHLSSAAEEIDRLSGVDVQFTYPKSGRLIAVLETETLKQQQALLRSIQGLQHVHLAELVYHRIDDGGPVGPLSNSDSTTTQAGKRLKTI